jgi:hypothetical protein
MVGLSLLPASTSNVMAIYCLNGLTIYCTGSSCVEGGRPGRVIQSSTQCIPKKYFRSGVLFFTSIGLRIIRVDREFFLYRDTRTQHARTGGTNFLPEATSAKYSGQRIKRYPEFSCEIEKWRHLIEEYYKRMEIVMPCIPLTFERSYLSIGYVGRLQLCITWTALHFSSLVTLVLNKPRFSPLMCSDSP